MGQLFLPMAVWSWTGHCCLSLSSGVIAMIVIKGLLFEEKCLKQNSILPTMTCGRSSPFTQEEIEAYGGKVISLRIVLRQGGVGMSKNSCPQVILRITDDVYEISGVLQDLSKGALPPDTSVFLHSTPQPLFYFSIPGPATHISLHFVSVPGPSAANAP